MRAVPRYGVAFVVAAAVLGAFGGLGALFGFRLNLTESLPRGIYRTTGEAPRRGSIVVVCLPLDAAELARERGYLGPGSCPGGVRGLGKVVLAMGDDFVTHRADGTRVNQTPIPNRAPALPSRLPSSCDSRQAFPWLSRIRPPTRRTARAPTGS